MAELLPAPQTADPNRCAELLRAWVARQVPGATMTWLDQQIRKVATGDTKTFFLAFGLIPRKTAKDDLALSDDDLRQADAARSRWQPRGWTIDQAARAVLVLSFPSREQEPYIETLDKLFAAGEVGELVALYQSLPILPHQHVHVLRAAEGIRTNIKAVFCAVAHGNPYPAEQLDEARWNQMVLKCLFIDAPLHPIIGLDDRANPTLMRMLVDYAHERWSAGRPVSPELWRSVGPYADHAAVQDLARVLDKGTPVEQMAAALALSACPRKDAADALRSAPELARRVRAGEITWESIGIQTPS